MVATSMEATTKDPRSKRWHVTHELFLVTDLVVFGTVIIVMVMYNSVCRTFDGDVIRYYEA